MRLLQVSEFVEVVNTILKETLSLEVFAVEGEVSGYRVSQGQWVSFDLKDDNALVNVFLPLWKLQVPVEDGMRVKVIGLPRVYPKYGKFSLSAERIELTGEGALRKALAALRVRLEKEGMFDPSRKRGLPRFPERIALIASRESAAYGDFIRVLSERWGGLKIDLYHVVVQGERAPDDITAALTQASSGEYDAIIVTRGGGSFEELMCFNDERVVRAIHASKIPTMVAIGHERDLTLAEEAADVRGSTPTDCARRLVPDRRDVQYELATLLSSIETEMLGRVEHGRSLIERALNAPASWIGLQRSALREQTSRLETGVRQWLRSLQERLAADLRLLGSLDPKAVLSRGYAIVRDASGNGIGSATLLHSGDALRVTFHDGEVQARVDGTDQQKLL
ncbi:MAG: exodeoxyribonuclease VII large subunit [Patescibacteria group bacterium]|jgi:exodeoxyribonuclease VII large subunit